MLLSLYSIFAFVRTVSAVASSDCSSNNANLKALRQQVQAPIPFCKFWLAVPKRSSTPFKSLSASVVTSVCRCISKKPALASPIVTTTLKLPAPTGACSPADYNVLKLRADIREPKLFCSYWQKSQRVRTPFTNLNVRQIASVCSCAQKTDIFNYPKPTTSIRRSTSKRPHTSTKSHTKTVPAVTTYENSHPRSWLC